MRPRFIKAVARFASAIALSGFKVDRPLCKFDGLLPFPLFQQCAAQIADRDSTIRLTVNGFAIRGDGSVNLPRILQRLAEIGECHGAVRSDGNRLPEQRRGRFALPKRHLDRAEIDVGVNIIGVAGNRAPVAIDCFG